MPNNISIWGKIVQNMVSGIGIVFWELMEWFRDIEHPLLCPHTASDWQLLTSLGLIRDNDCPLLSLESTLLFSMSLEASSSTVDPLKRGLTVVFPKSIWPFKKMSTGEEDWEQLFEVSLLLDLLWAPFWEESYFPLSVAAARLSCDPVKDLLEVDLNVATVITSLSTCQPNWKETTHIILAYT